MATYDDREAKQLVALAAARLNSSSYLWAKIQAARTLFDLLRSAFEGTQGFYCSRDLNYAGDFYAIGVPNRGGVRVAVDETEGAIAFFRRGDNQLDLIEKLDLPFDPVAGVLTTDEFDSFSVPTPGQLRLRRSPLAVAVEKALILIEVEIASVEAKRAEAAAS